MTLLPCDAEDEEQHDCDVHADRKTARDFLLAIGDVIVVVVSHGVRGFASRPTFFTWLL
jgi:hypothetical protein